MQPKPRAGAGRVERRRSSRRECNLPAIIFIPGTSMAIPCTMVNESSSGACLRLSAARARQNGGQSYVPREFWVWMSVDRCRVKCEPVWEKDDKIGVRFLSIIETAKADERNTSPNEADTRCRFGPMLRNQF
ncbi:MAG: PilZ domain-containing protein [Pseudomonadota bacterium]